MAMNGSLQNTSVDLKELTFVILQIHASACVRKERSSPTSRVTRETSGNKFTKERDA